MEKNLYRVIIPLLFSTSAAFAGGPDIIIEPDYFNGFYIGGIGSLHQSTFNTSSSTSISDPFTFFLPPHVYSDAFVVNALMDPSTPFKAGSYLQYNAGGGGVSAYGGIQGGMGKVFYHHWYLGAVGWGEWGNQNNSSSTAVFNNSGTNLNGLIEAGRVETSIYSATSTTKVKIENNYGIAAKLGFTVTPTTLVYGKIGAIWSQLKITNDTSLTSSINITGDENFVVSNANATLSGSSKNNNTKSALVTGIGLDQFFYKDIASINIEYNYADFGSISTTTPLFLTGQATESLIDLVGENLENSTVSTSVNNAKTNATTTASSKVKVSTLLVGINFHFGQGWL